MPEFNGHVNHETWAFVAHLENNLITYEGAKAYKDYPNPGQAFIRDLNSLAEMLNDSYQEEIVALMDVIESIHYFARRLEIKPTSHNIKTWQDLVDRSEKAIKLIQTANEKGVVPSLVGVPLLVRGRMNPKVRVESIDEICKNEES